jgi:hypothetical protein
MYWCCAQVEPRRDRLASHCLGLAGYEIYQPLLREQRRSHGRKIIATPPLFPSYLFVWVVRGWWDARWSPGVVRLIMDGLLPARVPDTVINEIRSRERNGFVELPKPRGLVGMKVRVLQGPLKEQIGLLPRCVRTNACSCCCSCSAVSDRSSLHEARSKRSSSGGATTLFSWRRCNICYSNYQSARRLPPAKAR